MRVSWGGEDAAKHACRYMYSMNVGKSRDGEFLDGPRPLSSLLFLEGGGNLVLDFPRGATKTERDTDTDTDR